MRVLDPMELMHVTGGAGGTAEVVVNGYRQTPAGGGSGGSGGSGSGLSQTQLDLELRGHLDVPPIIPKTQPCVVEQTTTTTTTSPQIPVLPSWGYNFGFVHAEYPNTPGTTTTTTTTTTRRACN